ncbi:hypothetical protein OIU77_020774, partial [Salix suchowensis]
MKNKTASKPDILIEKTETHILQQPAADGAPPEATATPPPEGTEANFSLPEAISSVMSFPFTLADPRMHFKSSAV